MWSKREEIDYALQRRKTLQSLRRRTRCLENIEVCDADPMLVRAALHHGEESGAAYLLGDGIPRRPPRRQPTVEDIYG